MPESEPHRRIKELIASKLHEWFGASVKEYPSSGHELDVIAVTSSGTSIYVEVIWSYSKTQFMSDMNMLQQSGEDVKVAVGSPEIIMDINFAREFSKVAVSQRKSGKVVHGEILNGVRILEDAEYVENDLKKLFEALVSQAESSLTPKAVLEITELRAVKSEWASGNLYNIIGRVLCAGPIVIQRLNAKLQFLENQAQAKYVSVSNAGKIIELNWRDLNYSWSSDGSDEGNRVGEFPEMRQSDSIYVVFPDAVGFGWSFGEGLRWWKHLFLLTPSTSFKVKLIVNGISSSLTVAAERTMEFTT